MLEYMSQNWGNILVCLAVLAIAALCAVSLIRKKKAGKSGCSYGCGNCPSRGACHPGES